MKRVDFAKKCSSNDCEDLVVNRTLNILCEMGFSHELSMTAINSTNTYNIEALVNFMNKGENSWEHEFISNDQKICQICKESLEEHNLDKIPIFSSNLHQESVLTPLLSSSNQSIEPGGLTFHSICEICLFDIEEAYNLASCPSHCYCRACIIKYLETLISEGKTDHIKCPKVSCTSEFNDSEIEGLVSQASFNKYLKFKKRKLIDKDNRVKYCYQPDCEGLVRNDNKQKKQACDQCGSLVCFDCGLAWHQKKNCEEIIDKNYKSWATGREVQECPGCNFKVEKIDGCNHMSCVRCGHQWCWLCRGVYTYNHFSSFNPFGCPNMQSGNNIRTRWICCRIWCKRLKTILIWLLAVLLSPLLLVFGPAILFIWVMKKYNDFSSGNKCEILFLIIVTLFLIALFPLVDIVALIYYVCRSIKKCAQKTYY